MKDKIYGLSNDYLFKKIFSNKNFLIMFMSDVFNTILPSFYYINKELIKENKNLSYGVCDFILETETELIFIEIQNQKKKRFEERCMAYLSKNSGRIIIIILNLLRFTGY